MEEKKKIEIESVDGKNIKADKPKSSKTESVDEKTIKTDKPKSLKTDSVDEKTIKTGKPKSLKTDSVDEKTIKADKSKSLKTDSVDEKTIKADKPKSSKKKVLWITIPLVLAVLITGVVLGWYYYFIYYLKPNFSEGQYQSIVSSKSGEVSPGEEITYNINLKNTGNTTVTNMVIATSIPQNCELMASQPEAEFDSDTGGITFNIESIPKDTAQSASFTVKVNSPLDNGIVLRTGRVSFSYAVRDENLDFEIADICENTVVSSPDFSGFEFMFIDVNKGDLNITDIVEFDLTVKNSGNMNAKNVDIVSHIPEKLEILESSVRFPVSIDRGKNTITWNIKELQAGQSSSTMFKARIGTEFKHLETFRVTSSIMYNSSAVEEEELEGKVYGYPNFSESSYSVKDVNGGSVWAGDTLRYAVVVKNTGLREGKDFKLICPIPANTSLLKDSVKPAEGFEYVSSEKAVVWTIENLDMGEERIFEFSVAISESLTGGGSINSAFIIEGDEQYVELAPKTIGVRKYIYLTVVCMGDSHVAYTNWPARLDGILEGTYPRAEYNTAGVGVPGMASFQALSKFDTTVASHGPQIVVLGFGSNDVGTSLNSYRSAMTQLINKAKGLGATVIVHSIGYIDTSIWTAKADYKSYNDVLKSVCASTGVPYVDIYTPLAGNPGKYISDGLHWTSEGANLVTSLVFNTMRNYLDADGARR